MAIGRKQQRLETVLARIKDMAAKDSDDRSMFIDALELMLNDLQSQDAFGTESQCDPRGDGRNGIWSMKRIEGIDE